jgi:2-polyprenyl-6-methoxyphenol hydroxylase-like FAD-dependent oxidoreductase
MSEVGWRFMTGNPGLDCWTAWSGRDATIVLIPVDQQTVYGYASTTRAGTANDIDTESWLHRTFDRFAAPVPSVVHSLDGRHEALHHGAVEEVDCRPWWRGRVVIIGDAAHATGPVWAQGAALAIEDALVLARLVAGSRSPAEIGAGFERRRRGRVDGVRAATERMSRLAGLPLALRGLVAPVLGPKAYRAAYGPLRLPSDPG